MIHRIGLPRHGQDIGLRDRQHPCQQQVPVQLLRCRRLLGRGWILGEEVVVHAARRVHLGLGDRMPARVAVGPGAPGQEDGAVVARAGGRTTGG